MFRFLLFWFFLYSRLQSPVRWIAGKRFLHSVGCLFAHLTVSFVVQKPLKFSRPHLSNVDLISCAAKPFWKLLPEPRSWTVPPPLSSSNFRVTRPYAKVLEALRAEHYARWENRTWLVFLRVRYNFPKTICWGMLSFLKKMYIFGIFLSNRVTVGLLVAPQFYPIGRHVCVLCQYHVVFITIDL